ncbi:unnamed protein product [Paramecium pentaurelia]|uniref:Uncharacterized protein n=1 Tax=Paramecium pentaurelia TaxID=43138 RepID=A0A8S1TR98_9CILI|nr:unnamed protein product [Paramecium pentaurelia]
MEILIIYQKSENLPIKRIQIDFNGQIKQHIEDRERNMNYQLTKIKYISIRMNFRQRLLLYIIHMQPYFKNCLIVEQFQNKLTLNRLQQLKNKILKTELCLPKNTKDQFIYNILQYYETSKFKVINKIINKTLEGDIAILDITMDHLKEGMKRSPSIKNSITSQKLIVYFEISLEEMRIAFQQNIDSKTQYNLTSKLYKRLRILQQLKNGMIEITKRKNEQVIEELLRN